MSCSMDIWLQVIQHCDERPILIAAVCDSSNFVPNTCHLIAGSPGMYTHMIRQRAKALSKKPKTAWGVDDIFPCPRLLHATIVTSTLPCSFINSCYEPYVSFAVKQSWLLSAIQLGWWQSVSKGIVQLSRNLLFSCSLDHPVICIIHQNDCDGVAWHYLDELGCIWAGMLWLCWTKWQLQKLSRPLIVHFPCIYMEVITLHLLWLQCICFWRWLQVFTRLLHNTKESMNQAQTATLCILALSHPMPEQEHHSCDEYRYKWPSVW